MHTIKRILILFSRMASAPVADQLCTASANGNLLRVKFLLENGANVNGLNQFNRTPLQVAMLGNTKLVEELVKAGADPNVPDPTLSITVSHDVARGGWLDTLRVLLEHGADTNLVDNFGNLPLHHAASEGYLEVTKLLLECTKNPQATNKEGYTAAELAFEEGKMDVYNYIQNYPNK